MRKDETGEMKLTSSNIPIVRYLGSEWTWRPSHLGWGLEVAKKHCVVEPGGSYALVLSGILVL